MTSVDFPLKMATANVQNLMPFILRSTEFHSCVTVIAPNYGITFAHGAHKTLLIGSTLRLNTITNLGGQPQVGTVVLIDTKDLILLEIDPPVTIPELRASIPQIGCKYLLLGLSSTQQNCT